MTKTTQQELRIDLQRFNGDKAYALYSIFEVGDEINKYKLSVGGYTGTAGKSLKYRYYTSYSRSILKFKIRVGIIFAMNNYHYQW